MNKCVKISLTIVFILSVSFISNGQNQSAKPPIVNKMVRIPGGTFKMGSDMPGMGPIHTVNVSSFFINAYEVTNGEYKKCVDDGKCTQPKKTDSIARPSYFYKPGYADFPVAYVNWDQAKAYCEYIGARLPTETEWEYAARGGLEGKSSPDGDEISKELANYEASSPVRVGSYPPNRYGLYDMAGNVEEWVNDWCDVNSDYYKASPSKDPKGPPKGHSRVLRGGDFGDFDYSVTVFNRKAFSPTYQESSIGFRCAK
jgi:formylglycine-generating enzyme required for sulfatase activity